MFVLQDPWLMLRGAFRQSLHTPEFEAETGLGDMVGKVALARAPGKAAPAVSEPDPGKACCLKLGKFSKEVVVLPRGSPADKQSPPKRATATRNMALASSVEVACTCTIEGTIAKI
jgi:hypothetical protein